MYKYARGLVDDPNLSVVDDVQIVVKYVEGKVIEGQNMKGQKLEVEAEGEDDRHMMAEIEVT